jgi:hypothetical protein
MRSNVYTRLWSRLLLAPDAAVAVEPRSLPLRLRAGVGAAVARVGVDWLVGGPSFLARKLRSFRERPAPRATDGASPRPGTSR